MKRRHCNDRCRTMCSGSSCAGLTKRTKRQHERRARPKPMTRDIIPQNLASLHSAEEQLRQKGGGMIADDPRLQLHLAVTEAAMDLADMLRQFNTSDENLKVAVVLGMRTFNAFAASIKLALSGYHQNSALILRDVMETVFVLDVFAGDRSLIERWRFADKKARMKDFAPVKVRVALDARDGHTSKKRSEMYELFSELAGHPNMKSSWMMRPQKNGDAVIGPFMEATALEAVISEMGRLAVQVGEQLDRFFPPDWEQGMSSRVAFALLKQNWINRFYPTAASEQ